MRARAGFHTDAGGRSADSHREGGRRFTHSHGIAPADVDRGAIADADRHGDGDAFRNTLIIAHTDSGAVVDRHGDSHAGAHQHGDAHSHANGAAADPYSGGGFPAPIGTAVRVPGSFLGWAGGVGVGSA